MQKRIVELIERVQSEDVTCKYSVDCYSSLVGFNQSIVLYSIINICLYYINIV